MLRRPDSASIGGAVVRVGLAPADPKCKLTAMSGFSRTKPIIRFCQAACQRPEPDW